MERQIARFYSRDAEQLIPPDRPQRASHQRLLASVKLRGIVGRQVNSGVRFLSLA